MFEYAIIFFDLINISTIFQIFINKTLNELINQIYIVYLNDIFIYFKTKKKILTQRVYRVKTITKIQFLCQIDKMQIYDYINKILELYNFQSRCVDELEQNFRY